MLPALVLLLAACGGPAQGGLTNAPNPSRLELSAGEQHDAIANGPESCPQVEGDPDPLPHRVGRCPERPKKAAKQPSRGE